MVGQAHTSLARPVLSCFGRKLRVHCTVIFREIVVMCNGFAAIICVEFRLSLIIACCASALTSMSQLRHFNNAKIPSHEVGFHAVAALSCCRSLLWDFASASR
jgi:hypothetical protein